jgi:hypothetical protein
MIRRASSLAFILALVTAAPVLGQSTSTCNGKAAVGFIGISGIDCNCTIGSPNPENWAFRTEPRITSLEMNTRAGQLLKIGDVITHVNGHLITTREGARAMATLKPGETVIVTVRRAGETLRYALNVESSCRADARLGYYAPGRPEGVAPPPTQPSPYSRATPRPSTPRAVDFIPTPAPPGRQRGSFGFGLMCSGNCEIRVESNGALHFSEPPEVYSVERGSGADKSGIRRGDLITHVNGESITSKEGGRMFGTAKPGQSLRFTIRRGGNSRTVTLTAASAPVPGVELTKSSEALKRAHESLRELQREQQRQMERIQDELRASRAAEQDRVRDMQREFYRQEQDHRRKLAELSQELDRAESRMRAALTDSVRTSCAVATTAPRGGARTLRYTGVIGDAAEIEVRGPNPVTVTESGDEVVITAGQTQVKVKKPRK